MFWTIVGAILFATIGIPLIIKGLMLLYLAMGYKEFRQVMVFAILGILALLGVSLNFLEGGLFHFGWWFIITIPFFVFILFANEESNPF